MWEGVGDRTELQHIDPHSYGHQRFFPVLLGCSTGWPGAPLSAGCWLSLPHYVTNWSGLQTDWISCALSYIIVHAHSISPQNWPSEYALPPSLEWHVWSSSNGNNCHSLPVHQFVTVPLDFNSVPYCQPSSPTPMEYALQPSLDDMFRRVGGQYTTIVW